MSLQEYRQGQEIESRHYDFYALVMACMRQADDKNAKKLQMTFPDTWHELKDRYDLPGGKYEAEQLCPLVCGSCGLETNGTEERIHTACPVCSDGKLHDLQGQA